MPEEKAGREKESSVFENAIIEDIRPWGKFRSFPHEPARSIKILTVNPGGILSLQYHNKRSEFWIVLDEGLEITLGKRIWRPEKNEEVFVPRKVPHRIKCIGSQPARIMEIWIGDSTESDIIRLDDAYGRKDR